MFEDMRKNKDVGAALEVPDYYSLSSDSRNVQYHVIVTHKLNKFYGACQNFKVDPYA